MATFSKNTGMCNFEMGITSANQLQQWLIEHNNVIGLAMVGRSNVGKSSLINTFFGNKTARTSKTPGRTRQINIFKIQLADMDENLPNEFYLFDLPGYGHAEVSKEMAKNWELLMSAFFNYLSSNILIVNIQDARHPHLAADQEFYKFIRPIGIPTTLVFNKMDKLKKQKERFALEQIKPRLMKEYTWVKSIHFISAEKKTGCEELELGIISFMLDKLNLQ